MPRYGGYPDLGPEDNYSLASRLSRFLAGMSGLYGQSEDLALKKREQEQREQQQALARMLGFSQLQEKQREFDVQQTLREQQAGLAKNRRSAVSRMVLGATPQELAPEELEGLGDVKMDSALGKFLFPAPKEKKRDIRGTPAEGFYEFGETGAPTELTGPRDKTKPFFEGKTSNELEILIEDPATPPDQKKIAQAALARIRAADLQKARETGAAPYMPMPPSVTGPAPAGAPTAPPMTSSAQPTPSPGESPAAFKLRLEDWYTRQAPTAAEKNREMAGQTIEGIITRLEGLIEQGAFKNVGKGFGGRVTGAVQSGAAAAAQSNQAQVLYESLKEGILANPVRFFGDVGTLNEGDIRRARALFGSTTGDVGIFPPRATLPDTEETARNKLKQLRELIAEIKARPENRGRQAQPGATPKVADPLGIR